MHAIRNPFCPSYSFWLSSIFMPALPIKPDLTLKYPDADGHELVTDFYLPGPDAKNLPCILLRGPGGRHSVSAISYADLGKEGLCRRHSETPVPQVTLKAKHCLSIPIAGASFRTAFDTVQWLAKHPVNNW